MRRFLVSLCLMFTVSVLLPVTGYAIQFNAVGSRANGMGAAGVALIDDENAGHWNPANLGLPSATRGYQEDYATGLGVFSGAQIQSTRDFLKENQDLVDQFGQGDTLSNIVKNDFSDTTDYANYLKLFRELGDLTRDGQGILAHFNAGANIRHTNLSVSLSNQSDVAGFTNLNLSGILVGGLSADSDAARQFTTGDSSVTAPSTEPTSQEFKDAAKQVSKDLDNAFETQKLSPQDLGFDSNTTSDSIANAIASRAESDSDKVSAEDLTKASEIVTPGIVSLGDTTDSDSDASFDTENQRLVLQGTSINEMAFHYAKPDPLLNFLGSPLYLGSTLRLMQGRVAYVENNPFESNASDSTGELFNQEDDVKKSTDFGVDLGLTYDARETLGFKLAVVGKYLNSPSFEYPDSQEANDTPVVAPDEVTVDPQVRVGFSGYPLDFMPVDIGSDWWQLSADYDITTNETLMNDYEKKYVSVGNEFNLINSFWLNIALRAGARENLAEASEGRLYTGGVGVQLAGLNVDVSGVVSDKRVKDEEGNEQPTVAGGSFNLSYRF
ncbi:MAG: conjugal transfer protein TraF [bacterium]